ncbi:MAG TPA: FAD-dependent oxidoreductase, partial [Solirubrobacteraceae bacterium]|nr:FAD-dependent oxidoreductase [Solirubrobacteraceae bacterium]
MPPVPVRPDATAEGFDADVIVIGGGSAGAAAARRLVDAGASVLLLEAGETDANPAIHDNARMHELWGSDEDWGYQTVPQRHANGRRMGLPRGKVLGGSSSLNGTIWVRGAREDFDAWAYGGAEGWAWDDVLPVFRRIESHDRGASDLHGAEGPIAVLSEYEPDPIHAALIEATVQAGIPRNPDYTGGVLDGVAPMQLNVRDGSRASTSQAYLLPIAEDPRLLVLTGAHVTRVLIEGGRAVGVQWRRGGALERAAAGEVIVAAGAIGSPLVLMLSGVGPAAHLAEHGIDVVADLPGVGANLHDHVLAPVICTAEREVAPPTPPRPACGSHFWVRSRPGLLVPDLQPLYFSVPLAEPWMTLPTQNAVTLYSGLVRPASRGSVRLTGPGVDDEPAIDLGALSCRADLEAIVAGLELIRGIVEQPALADWGLRPAYPAPELAGAELEDYVRDTLVTYHHQAGTCRIGIDAGAVVDPRLRVHGIEGLRVA